MTWVSLRNLVPIKKIAKTSVYTSFYVDMFSFVWCILEGAVSGACGNSFNRESAPNSSRAWGCDACSLSLDFTPFSGSQAVWTYPRARHRLQDSWALFIFLFLFLLLRLSNLNLPIFMVMYSSSYWNLMLNSKVQWIFHFSYFLFQLQDLHLVLFCDFCLLIDIFCLPIHYSGFL